MATNTRRSDPQELAGSLSEVLGLCVCGRRLEILLVLARGPQDVSALSLVLELEVSHISHHLRPLRDAGLVQVEQDRRRRVYSLGPACALAPGAGRLVLWIQAPSGCRICLSVPDLTPPAAAAPARPGSAR